MKTRWWTRHSAAAKNGRNGRAFQRALERSAESIADGRRVSGLLRDEMSDAWAADTIDRLCDTSDDLGARCERMHRKTEYQQQRIDRLETALGMGRATFGEIVERLDRLDGLLAEVQRIDAPDPDTAALFGELRDELQDVFADGVRFADEVLSTVRSGPVPPRPRRKRRWRSRWGRKWRRYLDLKLDPVE